MKLKTTLQKHELAWLVGALLVGFLARLPGVFWGANFPGGWEFHHVDEFTHWVIAEHMIDPSTPQRWQHSYPNGTAAQVALPLIAYRALTGQLFDKAPGITPIVVTGRVISLFYGTATILVVFLIARKLFRDRRVGLAAAWIMALGGLHVTQSHFFLADTPALFWYLLGVDWLLVDSEQDGQAYSPSLMGAAFAFGVALGLKLLVITLPSLIIAAIWRRPRLLRAVYATVFVVAGYGLINLFSYDYYDFFKALTGMGIAGKCDCSELASLGLYLVELPSLVSLPILILALVGALLLLRRWLAWRPRRGYRNEQREAQRFWSVGIAVILPLVIYGFLVIFTLDHFLRHLILYIPWMALAVGWSVIKLMDALRARKIHPAVVIVPLFIYLSLFVFDGERLFIDEPRNKAMDWIQENVPSGTTYFWRSHGELAGYTFVEQPIVNSPEMLVFEMQHTNQILSGYGLKNSLPRDYRQIFGSQSQANVDWTQAIFAGKSEYKEAARFKEGYFMPEFSLVEKLLGNRSRNYLAEIVIFIIGRGG